MSDNWKNLDLAGEGLQSINLEMTRRQKKLSTAILCWCLFPLGLHRLYLHQYRTLAVWWLLIIGGLVLASALALTPLIVIIPLIIWGLVDLFRLPDHVSQYNKTLKMQLYLQGSHQPPENYRGRYTDDNVIEEYTSEKEKERAGHQEINRDKHRSKQHIMSFAEQEALLKQMQQRKKPQAPPPDSD